jgi:hypothetical protein
VEVQDFAGGMVVRTRHYKSEGWAYALLMIGTGTLIGRPYWLVKAEGTGVDHVS